MPAPDIEGSVQLESTDIFADQLGGGAAVQPVTLTAEDYRMLESYFGYTPSRSAATQSNIMDPGRWT